MLDTNKLTQPQAVDINAIQERLPNQKQGKYCYDLFRKEGLNLGSSFQGVETLYYSEKEALGKISLSKETGFVLQPGLLDSALHTAIGLSLGKKDWILSLPFSVKAVNIYGEVSQTEWSYARKSASTKTDSKVDSYDVDLLSATGEVLLSFKEFVTLPLDGLQQLSDTVSSKDASLQLYTNNWKEEVLVNSIESTAITQVVLVAGGSASFAEKLAKALEHEVIHVNESSDTDYFKRVLSIVQSKIKLKEGTNLIVLYCNSDYVHYGFISGLLKTAQLEQPQFRATTIGVDNLSLKEIDTIVQLLKREQVSSSQEVKYQNGKREVTTPK